MASATHMEIIAMEGDVDRAERDLDVGEVRDQTSETLGQGHTSRMDADECDSIEIIVALDDLVRDARRRPAQRLSIEQKLPLQLACSQR
jgi:hypothetical protein